MTKNALTKFDFTAGMAVHPVRVVEIDGAPWFVAKDVLRALGVNGDTYNHLRKVPAAHRRNANRISIGEKRAGKDMALVNEAGVYDLILRCDKPAAVPFRQWVTGDVIPAIRKDGAYIVGEEKVASGEMDEDEFVLRALEIMKDRRKATRGNVAPGAGWPSSARSATK